MATREVTVELKRVSYIDVCVSVEGDKAPDDWLGLIIEQQLIGDEDIDFIESATPLDARELHFKPDQNDLEELMRVMKEYRAAIDASEGVSDTLLRNIAEQLDACCKEDATP